MSVQINGTTGVSLVQDEVIERRTVGRNLIVNGSCQIDQVNNGALITPTSIGYPIDNIVFYSTQTAKIQTQ